MKHIPSHPRSARAAAAFEQALNAQGAVLLEDEWLGARTPHWLRCAEGHEVINPAENPEPPCGSWIGYMRMSVGQVVTCDAIFMLPGWGKSRAAILEHLIAKQLELTVLGDA